MKSDRVPCLITGPPGSDSHKEESLRPARREVHWGEAPMCAPNSPSEVQFREIYSRCKPLGGNFSNQPYDSKAIKALAA